MKLFAAVVIGLAIATGAQAADDRRAIEAAIQAYFDASDHNDAAALARAFHASTVMYWIGEDGLVRTRDQADWRQLLRAAKAPAQSARERQIVWIDQAGEGAAAAALSRFADYEFHDFLTLLRVGGHWRIVGKVFTKIVDGTPGEAGAANRVPSSAADMTAVRALIERKFVSMDNNDGALLQSCYLPRASTASVLERDLVIYPIAEWAARFESRAAAGQRATGVVRTIERLEVDRDVAFARFSHRSPNARVIDYVLLVREVGLWRIAHLDYVSAPSSE